MRRVDAGQHGRCTISTTAASIWHSRALPADELAALESLVWPPGEEEREASQQLWASESLRCGVAEHPTWGRAGLEQGSNGPCGALAAVQARLVAQRLCSAGPRDELHLLAEAVAGCLEDAARTTGAGEPPTCSVILPPVAPDGSARVITAAGAALRSVLLGCVAELGPSALLLSLVATRGREQVAAEVELLLKMAAFSKNTVQTSDHFNINSRYPPPPHTHTIPTTARFAGGF